MAGPFKMATISEPYCLYEYLLGMRKREYRSLVFSCLFCFCLFAVRDLAADVLHVRYERWEQHPPRALRLHGVPQRRFHPPAGDRGSEWGGQRRGRRPCSRRKGGVCETVRLCNLFLVRSLFVCFVWERELKNKNKNESEINLMDCLNTRTP